MRDYLILGFLALLFFFPFLGGVHLFDWDEINFAESAREMLATGDWFRPQIDFEPFWEKPPLFIWFQAISMSIFGVSEFAARLPNAICGLATLLLVFNIGQKLFDRRFAWLWAMGWLGSLLPHLYFRSGIIDPWFNFFTFLGLYGFIRFRWMFFRLHKIEGFWLKYRWLIGGGLALGLAILTKGPVAYLITVAVIVAYWAKYRFRGHGYVRHLTYLTLAAFSVSGLWFAADVLMHGPAFVQQFLTYQIRLLTTPDAGHDGFFGYHFVVLLLGCFPASVFAISSLWGNHEPEEEVLSANTLTYCARCDFVSWMQILFWVVLLLFSVVQTKIVHYSSLCYFPLTFLAALTIWRALRFSQRPRFQTFALPIVGTVLGLTVAALPFLGKNPDLVRLLFSHDAFALANLEAKTCWSWFQSFPGVLLALASVAAAFFWAKNEVWKSIEIVHAVGAIFVAFSLGFFVKNVEAITQNAALKFYEEKSGEDCYIRPVGFKSFAHLFYAQKRPVTGDKTVDDYPNLAHGNPGKPVYFVAKCTSLEELPTLPGCREIRRENGFVFFEKVVLDKTAEGPNR